MGFAQKSWAILAFFSSDVRTLFGMHIVESNCDDDDDDINDFDDNDGDHDDNDGDHDDDDQSAKNNTHFKAMPKN